jgi:hypothetical protein
MRAGLAGVAVALAGCGRFGFDHGALPDGADGPLISNDSGDAAQDTYRATAVRFERAGDDYMWTGSLQSTASSARGTFSAWLHFNAGDGQQHAIAVAQVVAVGGVFRNPANRFEFQLYTCAGVPLLGMQSQGTYTAASGWVHLLAAWDLNAGRADLYVNDISDRTANPLLVPGPVCYDSIKWGIGGIVDGQLDADVADLYAALGTDLDLDVELNRRLFRDTSGKPVALGAGCNAPTGATATGCFVGDPATWNINKGSAAGFTLEGDGLTNAPTSPSD